MLELRPGEAEIGQFILKRLELGRMHGDANVGGVDGEGERFLEVVAHDALVHGALPLGDLAGDGTGEADDFVDGVGLKLIAAIFDLMDGLFEGVDELGHGGGVGGEGFGVAGFFSGFEAFGAALLVALGMAGLAGLCLDAFAFGAAFGDDLIGFLAGAEED